MLGVARMVVWLVDAFVQSSGLQWGEMSSASDTEDMSSNSVAVYQNSSCPSRQVRSTTVSASEPEQSDGVATASDVSGFAQHGLGEGREKGNVPSQSLLSLSAYVRDGGARTGSSTSQDAMQMVVSYLESVEPAIVEIVDELDRSTELDSMLGDYSHQQQDVTPYPLCQVDIMSAEDDDYEDTYVANCATSDMLVSCRVDQAESAWPGAGSRVARSPFVTEWLDREARDGRRVNAQVACVVVPTETGADVLCALRECAPKVLNISVELNTVVPLSSPAASTPRSFGMDDSVNSGAARGVEAKGNSDTHSSVVVEQTSGAHGPHDSVADTAIVEYDKEAWSRLLSARTHDSSDLAFTLPEQEMRRRFSAAFA